MNPVSSTIQLPMNALLWCRIFQAGKFIHWRGDFKSTLEANMDHGIVYTHIHGD